jgi:4-amino-4-deoxy-L-arabinose transferase-like glycosyltransferase
LAGFEVSDIWFNGGTDLENDWPAIYYYYGYVGFGLYLIFMLWFVVLIVKRVLLDFKGTVTLENFFLLLCLGLHVGLAQFSGSVLRRPNVSIYMALILGLIYYKTVYFPVSNSKEEKAV